MTCSLSAQSETGIVISAVPGIRLFRNGVPRSETTAVIESETTVSAVGNTESTASSGGGLSPSRRRKTWVFRLAAVLLGLSVLVVAEGVCRLCDVGHPDDYVDPFVGFSDVYPLFVLSEAGDEYEIPASRRNFFVHDSFPARKGSKEFRIFCLGGSTVQGRPHSVQTSFTTWLALGLKVAAPSCEWEVVNCGGISYASYRLLPILTECLDYEPDLFVICTGHNDFLEDRTYEHIRQTPKFLAVPLHYISRLRLLTLLRSGLLALSGTKGGPPCDNRPVLTAEVDALLDYNEGLNAYRRNNEWRRSVIDHYERNLRYLVSTARRAGVPVILMRPPSNLRNCPPFKSEHREQLTRAETKLWHELIIEAKSHCRNDPATSIRLLRQSMDIDDQYAATWYELGKCHDALGEHQAARESYLQAREQDICPLRILQPMEQALVRLARERSVPLIDVHELLESRARNRILGGFHLVDHIHPSFESHQLIANALIEQMCVQGMLCPQTTWHSDAAELYRQHFESLDSLYFLKGQQTLDSLRAWTQGRADGPPLEARIPHVTE